VWLVIDGKKNMMELNVFTDDGKNIKEKQKNHKLRRRRKKYAEIKARKEKHKLRVRSLSSRPIKKLTMLIV
jgi:hypothetical protein